MQERLHQLRSKADYVWAKRLACRVGQDFTHGLKISRTAGLDVFAKPVHSHEQNVYVGMSRQLCCGVFQVGRRPEVIIVKKGYQVSLRSCCTLALCCCTTLALINPQKPDCDSAVVSRKSDRRVRGIINNNDLGWWNGLIKNAGRL
jgi:hypothetical protein